MPDLVERDFTADRPGVKFVGDITYIHTWAGFVYLATVIDCYSKKVVGWSIADHMRTELVTDALKNAAATTRIEPRRTRFPEYVAVSFEIHGMQRWRVDTTMPMLHVSVSKSPRKKGR